MAALSGPTRGPAPALDAQGKPPSRFRNRVEEMIGAGNTTGARRAALASQLQDPNGAYWQGSAAPPPVRQVGTDGQVREFQRTPMQTSRWRQKMQQEVLANATPEYRSAAAEMAGPMRRTAMGYTDMPEDPGVRNVQPRNRVAEGDYGSGPIFNPGSVNGKAVMAPTAGNYGRALDLQRKMGLGSDPSPKEFRRRVLELAGEGLVLPDMTYDEQLLAAGSQASRQASAAAAEEAQKHARALELARAGKLTFDEQAALEGLKAQGRGADLPGVSNWAAESRAVQKRQDEWDQINQQLVGKIPEQYVKVGGKMRKVGELRTEIGARPETVPYPDWATEQASLGDPRFADGIPGTPSHNQQVPQPGAKPKQALHRQDREALAGYTDEDLEWAAAQYEAQGYFDHAAEVRAMKKSKPNVQAAR